MNDIKITFLVKKGYTNLFNNKWRKKNVKEQLND